jgi:hypothetical protein
MIGRKHREQASLFNEFRLDDMIPKGHLSRRINVSVTSVLGDLHEHLGPFYSDIGRSSIDPELLIRMLIIGSVQFASKSTAQLSRKTATLSKRPHFSTASTRARHWPHRLMPRAFGLASGVAGVSGLESSALLCA